MARLPGGAERTERHPFGLAFVLCGRFDPPVVNAVTVLSGDDPVVGEAVLEGRLQLPDVVRLFVSEDFSQHVVDTAGQFPFALAKGGRRQKLR